MRDRRDDASPPSSAVRPDGHGEQAALAWPHVVEALRAADERQRRAVGGRDRAPRAAASTRSPAKIHSGVSGSWSPAARPTSTWPCADLHAAEARLGARGEDRVDLVVEAMVEHDVVDADQRDEQRADGHDDGGHEAAPQADGAGPPDHASR